MPVYDKTGFVNVKSVVAGQPVYLFGGFNSITAPCKFQITNVSSSGTTATLTGYVREGNVPLVGDLISTQGLQSLTNVVTVPLTAVNLDPLLGTGTISFLDSQTVSSIADAGVANIPISEKSESLVNGSSMAVAVPYNNAATDGARTVKVVVTFPILPNAAVVTLQGAISNYDTEFQDLVTAITIVGGTPTVGEASITLEAGRFYRVHVTGVVLAGSPAGGSIIAKFIA
jgi:hypothetical protein